MLGEGVGVHSSEGEVLSKTGPRSTLCVLVMIGVPCSAPAELLCHANLYNDELRSSFGILAF